MSIRIRMSRAGKTKRAFFHIVVADSRSKRDGRIIEKIGYYDPVPNPPKVEIKSDRAIYWLGKGAQPSRTVYEIFKKKGIITPGKKIGAQTGVSAPQAGAPGAQAPGPAESEEKA